MYVLMVKFEPTRVAELTGGHNEGLNFGNFNTNTKDVGAGDVGIGDDGSWRKRECWNCGGDNLKRNFL